MCLYELLLLQGGCAVLPQPHPEEAVVDDIAAIVLVDEFSIDQRLESKTYAAGWMGTRNLTMDPDRRAA